MKVRITTLCENTANIGFVGEWGSSILVTVDDMHILLDCGATDTVITNAVTAGIDLKQVSKILLSHGHYDHTGGLRELLKRTGEKDIFAHPDIWTSKYASLEECKPFYVGIPFQEEELESHGALFHYSREQVALGKNIWATGEVPLLNDFEKIDPELFVKENGILKKDLLADDQSLVIDSPSGLIIILGCAHRGAINTLHRAQEISGKEQVYAVVGGTHLFRASEKQIQETVKVFRNSGVKKLGVSHCTGFDAAVRLKNEMPDAFFLNNAGTSLDLL